MPHWYDRQGVIGTANRMMKNGVCRGVPSAPLRINSANPLPVLLRKDSNIDSSLFLARKVASGIVERVFLHPANPEAEATRG